MRTPAGYTLVELLLAATLGALLLLALQGTLGTAFRVTDAVDRADRLHADADQLHRLLQDDVRDGAVRALSPRELSLTTASGDSVRYLWTGTPGDPLSVIRGTGPAMLLAEHVDHLRFDLHALTRTVPVETLLPDTQAVTLARFVPGDWDDHVAGGDCAYDGRERVAITLTSWAAVRFAAPEPVVGLTSVRVRVDHGLLPPTGFLRASVHRAAGSVPETPGTELAVGYLAPGSIPASPDWRTIDLSPSAVDTVATDQILWVVFSSAGVSSGRVELERVTCSGAPPATPGDLVTRTTATGGLTWSTPDPTRMAFVELTALGVDDVLMRIATPVVDTLGVAYELRLRDGDTEEVRSSHVAHAIL